MVGKNLEHNTKTKMSDLTSDSGADKRRVLVLIMVFIKSWPLIQTFKTSVKLAVISLILYT